MCASFPCWFGYGEHLNISGGVSGAKMLRKSACCASAAAGTVFMMPGPGLKRRRDGLSESRRSEPEKGGEKTQIAEKKPFPFNSFSPLCFLRTRHVSRLFPSLGSLQVKKKRKSRAICCFPSCVLMRQMNIHGAEGGGGCSGASEASELRADIRGLLC